MKHILLSLSAILLLFPFSILAQQETLYQDLLSAEWSGVSITDSLNKTKNIPSQSISLSLNTELQRFEHKFKVEDLVLTGTWELKDKTLILNEELAPAEHLIDSTVYKVIDGRPNILYYKDGKLLTSFEENKLYSEPVAHRYNIKKITPDTLVLSKEGSTFLYVNTKSKDDAFVQKTGGGFNITTLLRGLLGIAFLIFIAWIFSSNRRKISWRVVITGLIIQLSIAVGILFIPLIEDFFGIVGQIF